MSLTSFFCWTIGDNAHWYLNNYLIFTKKIQTTVLAKICLWELSNHQQRSKGRQPTRIPWVFLTLQKLTVYWSIHNSFWLRRSDAPLHYLSPMHNRCFVLVRWLHTEQVSMPSSQSPALKCNTPASLVRAPFSIPICQLPTSTSWQQCRPSN